MNARLNIQRWFWLPILTGWLLAALLFVRAAEPAAETRYFEASRLAFKTGFFDRVVREMTNFVAVFPTSTLQPQAKLLLAHARAELAYQGGDLTAAVRLFDQARQDFPDSPYAMDALMGSAYARLKLGDTKAAISLLVNPENALQKALRAQTKTPLMGNGLLVLAEAQLRVEDLEGALTTVTMLKGIPLLAEAGWKARYLEARLAIRQGKYDQAFAGASNLIAAARDLGRQGPVADAHELAGDALQKLNRTTDAIAEYEKNLDPAAPLENRRQALLKIASVLQAAGKLNDSAQKLEQYLSENAAAPDLDRIVYGLGDLRQKQYYRLLTPAGTNSPTELLPATNYLYLAKARYDQVITQYTNSPLLGRSFLNRGWCWWELGEGTNKALLSLPDFQEAAGRLPNSSDQAIALFKLGDCEQLLGRNEGAITNLQKLVDNYQGDMAMRSALLDQALYRIVQLAVESGRLKEAEAAMRRILDWYPVSYFGDRSVLLVSQAMNTLGSAAEARRLLEGFQKGFASSALLAEVKLAVAKTYCQESNWSQAIAVYTNWTALYANHPARPRALFEMGWVYSEAGNRSNAVPVFTNLVVEFPTNQMAALAHEWLGDYYREKEDWLPAETHYQQEFQTPGATSPQIYTGLKMAGKVAYARLAFKDAEGYFTELIKRLQEDTNSPSLRLDEAWFALGDTRIDRAATDPLKPLAGYDEAIGPLSRISSNSVLAPRALARIATCYQLLGSQNPVQYVKAEEFFTRAMTHPLADVATRSLAEIGLGKVLELESEKKSVTEQAGLMESALSHYLNVVFGKNLAAGEKADPLEFKEAGLAAARIVETRQKWSEAARLYVHLLQEMPALRPLIEPKLTQAQAKLDALQR